MHKTADSTT